MVLDGPSGTALFGGALAGAGALIALLGLRHAWRASAVLRAPAPGDRASDDPASDDPASDDRTSGDAAFVRLEGAVDAVEGDEPIEAPFSGTPSTVVRHHVSERRIGPNLPFLPGDVTVREGTDSAPFEVRTTSTTATVDGAVGTAILDPETVATVPPGESPPDRILAFDAEADVPDGGSPLASLPGPLSGLGRRAGLGRRTYTEHRLEPGEDATVVGRPLEDATVDPLVVSDRSPRGTVLAMARTGLVAVAIGLATGAIGLGVFLVG